MYIFNRYNVHLIVHINNLNIESCPKLDIFNVRCKGNYPKLSKSPKQHIHTYIHTYVLTSRNSLIVLSGKMSHISQCRDDSVQIQEIQKYQLRGEKRNLSFISHIRNERTDIWRSDYWRGKAIVVAPPYYRADYNS